MDITLSNGTFDTGLFGLSGGSRGGDVVTATFDWQNDPFNAAAVPEPASWALMIGGLGMAGATLRRRRATAATA
ncbi:MAG: PEP-CTERM sorting domain-containing protein [Phenylobacterium sp.]|nr:MAG: PEP-CTERM sorting domain-containing protein [Phenylobacterium sp.]